jgi:spermidine synthase
MTSSERTIRHDRAVLILIPIFLLSGAASLVYETLWARHLHVLFGTSQVAITTVLAAFMAGLALGGFGAARWAERIRRPLLAYAILEAFIGLYALLFPWLVRLVSPAYLGFWRALEPSPVLFGVFQFLLLGIVLLPPTVAMGATLPLLARFVTSDRSETGFQIGRLYGVNTFGAVLGTALAGFALLPRLGLSATTWWTAGLNGILAIIAVFLSRMGGPLAPVELTAREEPERADPTLRALLLIAALAGFAALVCEVAWFRLLALTLGASAYAFTIMLVGFLIGIGLGGWIGGRWSDRSLRLGGRKRVLSDLARIQIGVAVFCWAAMLLYGQLPFMFVWLYRETGGSTWLLFPAELLLSLLIMVCPTFLMGATFPYLVRAAAGPAETISRPVGRLYGFNTIGALLGAGLGGLVLLPALHIRGAVLAAVAVNICAAFVAGAAALAATGGKAGVPVRPRLARWATVAAVAIVLMFVFKPPWNPILMTSGMYKYVSGLDNKTRKGVLDFAVRPFDLLFYDEGLTSVVTVARNRGSGNIWLANNGKVDASTQSDIQTQNLLVHLPFLARPEAKRVLIVGLASGISLGSATLYPNVEEIDVIEIEPVVVTASHQFDEYNHRPLEDPRVRLHVNDARNHLLLTKDGTYDLVSSEPSNPWITGVSNLFTREFFELGKRKLAPGGVWGQWLQIYGMTPGEVKTILATFADVYPYVQVFRVDESDLVLLGSDEPLPLSTEQIAETVSGNEGVIAELGALEITGADEIMALYHFDQTTIAELAGDAELNTDNNMLIEYSAPLHIHAETRVPNLEMLLGAAEIPVDAVDGARGLMHLARAYFKYDWDGRRAMRTLEIAMEMDPDDAGIRDYYTARVLEKEQGTQGGGAAETER